MGILHLTPPPSRPSKKVCELADFLATPVNCPTVERCAEFPGSGIARPCKTLEITPFLQYSGVGGIPLALRLV